jgi:hypothetical protein
MELPVMLRRYYIPAGRVRYIDSGRRRCPYHPVACRAIQCDHLRTAHARGPAFLLKPSAVPAYRAWRQGLRDGWKYLHDSGHEPAVLAIEMTALTLDARRGKPENFSRLDWRGERQHIVCHRRGLVEIQKPRLCSRASHNTKDTAVRHLGKRART